MKPRPCLCHYLPQNQKKDLCVYKEKAAAFFSFLFFRPLGFFLHYGIVIMKHISPKWKVIFVTVLSKEYLNSIAIIYSDFDKITVLQ